MYSKIKRFWGIWCSSKIT